MKEAGCLEKYLIPKGEQFIFALVSVQKKLIVTVCFSVHYWFSWRCFIPFTGKSLISVFKITVKY